MTHKPSDSSAGAGASKTESSNLATVKDFRCLCALSFSQQQLVAYSEANANYGSLRTVDTEALEIMASVANRAAKPPTAETLEILGYDHIMLEDAAAIADELVKLRAFAVAMLSDGSHERCPPEGIGALARRVFNEHNGTPLWTPSITAAAARTTFAALMRELSFSMGWRSALTGTHMDNDLSEADAAQISSEEAKFGRNW